FYGTADAKRALNLSSAISELRPIADLPAEIVRENFAKSAEIDIRPPLLTAALLLVLLDLMIAYALRGLLRRRSARPAAPVPARAGGRGRGGAGAGEAGAPRGPGGSRRRVCHPRPLGIAAALHPARQPGGRRGQPRRHGRADPDAEPAHRGGTRRAAGGRHRE